MKALVLKTYKQFTCEDVPVPEFGPDEVLVAVKACGICGSDVHGMDGSTGRRRPPIIMGHEAAGVIAKAGGAVTGWKPGDRVTFDSTIYCGQCDFCHAGRINLCSNRRVLGVSCDEYRQDGAFAEFVAVPARIIYRLPDALSFEHAALVEPLSIALHATRVAQSSRGQTAVVIGAGIIGLMLVQALRAAACEQIIVVDVAPERLAMAAQLGATATINSANADAPAEILWLTNNRGADLAFEAVGITATVDLAVRSVRKGGAVDTGGQRHTEGGTAVAGRGGARAGHSRFVCIKRRVYRLPGSAGARHGAGVAAHQCGCSARGRRGVVRASLPQGTGLDESHFETG